MALKDKRIPNDTIYLKLKDFPDGEKIFVNDCGINEDAKFGPQPFFVTAEGERITLPSRYCDYIGEIMVDTGDYTELRRGITIIKNSRTAGNGSETAIFEIE